ncbi:hypothetical protein P9112_002434 [Eukaryota sp. TZLM1-RC]
MDDLDVSRASEVSHYFAHDDSLSLGQLLSPPTPYHHQPPLSRSLLSSPEEDVTQTISFYRTALIFHSHRLCRHFFREWLAASETQSKQDFYLLSAAYNLYRSALLRKGLAVFYFNRKKQILRKTSRALFVHRLVSNCFYLWKHHHQSIMIEKEKALRQEQAVLSINFYAEVLKRFSFLQWRKSFIFSEKVYSITHFTKTKILGRFFILLAKNRSIEVYKRNLIQGAQRFRFKKLWNMYFNEWKRRAFIIVALRRINSVLFYDNLSFYFSVFLENVINSQKLEEQLINFRSVKNTFLLGSFFRNWSLNTTNKLLLRVSQNHFLRKLNLKYLDKSFSPWLNKAKAKSALNKHVDFFFARREVILMKTMLSSWRFSLKLVGLNNNSNVIMENKNFELMSNSFVCWFNNYKYQKSANLFNQILLKRKFLRLISEKSLIWSRVVSSALLFSRKVNQKMLHRHFCGWHWGFSLTLSNNRLMKLFDRDIQKFYFDNWKSILFQVHNQTQNAQEFFIFSKKRDAFTQLVNTFSFLCEQHERALLCFNSSIISRFLIRFKNCYLISIELKSSYSVFKCNLENRILHQCFSQWLLSHKVVGFQFCLFDEIVSQCFQKLRNNLLTSRCNHFSNQKSGILLNFSLDTWKKRADDVIIADNLYFKKHLKNFLFKWMQLLINNIEKKEVSRTVDLMIEYRLKTLKSACLVALKRNAEKNKRLLPMERYFVITNQKRLISSLFIKWFGLGQGSRCTKALTTFNFIKSYFRVWQRGTEKSIKVKDIQQQVTSSDQKALMAYCFSEWNSQLSSITRLYQILDQFINSKAIAMTIYSFRMWKHGFFTRIKYKRAMAIYLMNLKLKYYSGWKGFVLSCQNMEFRSTRSLQSKLIDLKSTAFTNWKIRSFQKTSERNLIQRNLYLLGQYFVQWNYNHRLFAFSLHLETMYNRHLCENFLKFWLMVCALNSVERNFRNQSNQLLIRQSFCDWKGFYLRNKFDIFMKQHYFSLFKSQFGIKVYLFEFQEHLANNSLHRTFSFWKTAFYAMLITKNHNVFTLKSSFNLWKANWNHFLKKQQVKTTLQTIADRFASLTLQKNVFYYWIDLKKKLIKSLMKRSFKAWRNTRKLKHYYHLKVQEEFQRRYEHRVLKYIFKENWLKPLRVKKVTFIVQQNHQENTQHWYFSLWVDMMNERKRYALANEYYLRRISSLLLFNWRILVQKSKRTSVLKDKKRRHWTPKKLRDLSSTPEHSPKRKGKGLSISEIF